MSEAFLTEFAEEMEPGFLELVVLEIWKADLCTKCKDINIWLLPILQRKCQVTAVNIGFYQSCHTVESDLCDVSCSGVQLNISHPQIRRACFDFGERSVQPQHTKSCN